MERRILTVLFADLVGFTTLSEGLDPEDVATIQDAYFSSVRETIERHGGRVEKFIGDAAMAVFGLPRTSDDDAVRGVAAGLALTSAIGQIAARLGLEPDRLRLRVGVNTGEIAYQAEGPDAGRVSGDVVNTAARLQTAAPPGGVLVGEETALATGRAVVLTDAGEVDLKGKAEPVRTWLAEGVRPESERDEAVGTLQAPLIGRDAELTRVVGLLTRADGEAGRRLLVVAPPGVGKSRLVREAVDASATTGFTIPCVRVRRESGSPFEPLLQVFASLTGALGPGLPGAVAAALENAGVVDVRRQVLAHRVETLLDPATRSAGEDNDREALFRDYLEILLATGHPGTPRFVVEDVHWASQDLLEFLSFAVASSSASIMVTARPSLLETLPEWCDPVTDDRLEVLNLGPLPAADTRALVEAIMGDELPSDLLATVVERSGGNALFVEELLRSWASAGIIVRAGGRWSLTRRPADVSVPTTVHTVYAAQLDDLPPASRRLSQEAAVVGTRFAHEAVTASSDVEELAEMASLLRRRFISGPDPDLYLGDTYQFRHALLRDAAYASLAKSERSLLHLQVARWLEEIIERSGPVVAESAAMHFAAALEMASALSEQVGGELTRAEVQARAARWFETAAGVAKEMGATSSAEKLYMKAIDMTPEDRPLELGRLWRSVGEVRSFGGDMDDALAAFTRAVALYVDVAGAREEPSWRQEYALSVSGLCHTLRQQIRFAEMESAAREGLATLGEARDAPSGHLSLALGWALEGTGAPMNEITALFERSLDIARSSDDEELSFLAEKARVMTLPDDQIVSPNEFDGLIRSARSRGKWGEVVDLSRMQAVGAFLEGSPSAWAVLDSADTVARARGLVEPGGWLDYCRAEFGLAWGEWDRGLEAAERAMKAAESFSYHRLMVRTAFAALPMALERGELSMIERFYAWHEDHEDLFPDSDYSRVHHTAIDLIAASCGLRELVLPDLGHVAAGLSDPVGMPSWTAAIERLIAAWLDAGEMATARDALQLALAGSAAAPAERIHGAVLYLLDARCRAAEGDTEAALRRARESLDLMGRDRLPWWRSKAMRLLAECGDPTFRDEAMEIERDLKLKPREP